MIKCQLTGSSFLRLANATSDVEYVDVIGFAVVERLKTNAPDTMRELAVAKASDYFCVLSGAIEKIEQSQAPEKDELVELMLRWFTYQLYICFGRLTSKLNQGEWSETKVNAFFDKIYRTSKHVREIVDGTCRAMSDEKTIVYYTPLVAPVQAKPVSVQAKSEPFSTYSIIATLGVLVLVLIYCYALTFFVCDVCAQPTVCETNVTKSHLAISAPPTKAISSTGIHLALPAPPAKGMVVKAGK